MKTLCFGLECVKMCFYNICSVYSFQIWFDGSMIRALFRLVFTVWLTSPYWDSLSPIIEKRIKKLDSDCVTVVEIVIQMDVFGQNSAHSFDISQSFLAAVVVFLSYSLSLSLLDRTQRKCFHVISRVVYWMSRLMWKTFLLKVYWLVGWKIC